MPRRRGTWERRFAVAGCGRFGRRELWSSIRSPIRSSDQQITRIERQQPSLSSKILSPWPPGGWRSGGAGRQGRAGAQSCFEVERTISLKPCAFGCVEVPARLPAATCQAGERLRPLGLGVCLGCPAVVLSAACRLWKTTRTRRHRCSQSCDAAYVCAYAETAGATETLPALRTSATYPNTFVPRRRDLQL